MKLLLALLAVGLIVVAALLVAAPQGVQKTNIPTPQTAPQQTTLLSTNAASSTVSAATTTTPIVGTPIAAPTIIFVNSSTPVMVTTQITDTTLIPGSVNLLRIGTTGTQPIILGVMQNVGNGMYSLQPAFNETTTGQIQLQVSAAFRGRLRRVTSQVIQVPVWGMVSDATSGFTAPYPPGLNNLTDSNTPPGTFDLESALNGVSIGGAVPEGSSVSTSGFAIALAAKPYSISNSFDIMQYLSTKYPNSVADASITPVTISGQRGYEVTFPGEVGGSWPIAIVYHQGYVYTILYNSTDYIAGFSDQVGLDAFNNILQHFTFIR